MNVVDELEAAGREDATENAESEAENVVVELEVACEVDTPENAAPKAENVEVVKAVSKRKTKKKKYVRRKIIAFCVDHLD